MPMFIVACLNVYYLMFWSALYYVHFGNYSDDILIYSPFGRDGIRTGIMILTFASLLIEWSQFGAEIPVLQHAQC